MITKLKQEISELNRLIKEKTNQKQSVINRWQYLKQGKEAQVKVLEKAWKLVNEHIKFKIRETHQIINDIKSKYEKSITREKTYLKYRKTIKILEELQKELKLKFAK